MKHRFKQTSFLNRFIVYTDVWWNSVNKLRCFNLANDVVELLVKKKLLVKFNCFTMYMFQNNTTHKIKAMTFQVTRNIHQCQTYNCCDVCTAVEYYRFFIHYFKFYSKR